MLIGLSGYAGAGKSEAAKILYEDAVAEDQKVVILKFAAGLKNMLAAIGLTRDEIEGSLKERPRAMLSGHTPRFAMQTLGTEWGRKIMGEDFWVNLWEAKVHDYLEEEYLVIADDVRFDNELQSIYRLGGHVMRINGVTACGTGTHESERLPQDPRIIDVYNTYDESFQDNVRGALRAVF